MINIAEKLKNTPIRTKLYSPMIGKVYLEHIEFSTNGDIWVVPIDYDRTHWVFDKYGRNKNSDDEDRECLLFPSKEQRDWNNYTIKKKYVFKPFDKVVVRDSNNAKWQIDLFGYMGDDSDLGNFYCLSRSWKQCLPYNEETVKLIGTTDNYED